MQKVNMKVKKWAHFKGDLPKYETAFASGFDVRAQLSQVLILEPGKSCMVPTGLSFEIPVGYEIQVRPRSGLAAKKGITVLNTPGTVDADYRGEVKVILINLGTETFEINDQERIAQMVLCPVMQVQMELVSELSDTARGVGGFGSTGVQ
ncbi:MAG: dUTP diphosphatase [Bdellovibrionaceae bacterium]|nr:dUTP diphosphatase [Pseudobdellovibrionaceae bacterium]